MSIKLISELTAEDLTACPVWQHWFEKEKEYVKPVNVPEISDGDKGYIVLTEFILHNQKLLTGFCSPQDPSGIDYIHPVIFTHGGQVNFYKDHNWTLDEEKEVLDKFKLNKEEVFPVSYKAKIKSNGIFCQGEITGFNQGTIISPYPDF